MDYETPALSKVNKLLCLTLDTLKAMRLPSKLVVRPIIRIWEGHQLPHAERLVAESLVAQNGFNATEAGGKATSLANPLSLRIARRDVFVNKSFFQQHVASVKSQLDEGARFVNDVHGLGYAFSRLNAETSKLDEQLDSFAANESWTWEDACQLLEQKQKLSEKRINANFNLRVRLQMCQTLLKSMSQESLGRSLRPSGRDFIAGTSDEMDVD
ncbi:hypothetical protein J3458_022122 [Metarhizium acridum]|uniref:uncharacterized protein n=1 Tax=Metarhizium acridum TaxID=92637 RepID=UPI001C6B7D96|nr:hypothetical protein J3458_022122 [Metarhizium acridum]